MLVTPLQQFRSLDRTSDVFTATRRADAATDGALRHSVSSWQRCRRTAGLAIAALVTMHGAQAFEIQAYSRTTQQSVFPTTFSDVQTSQVLTSVSASQNGPDPAGGHFESRASVDLMSASLKGLSSVSNVNAARTLTTESTARLDESIQLFLGPQLPPPPFSPITLTLHAHGSFSAMAGPGTAYALFSLNVDNGGGYFVVDCSAPCNAVHVSNINMGNVSPVVISNNPAGWSVDFVQTFNVPAAFNLHVNMSTQATSALGGSATLDVYNTARVEMMLPPGYGFTSSSGVFLSPVAEPGTALLLMAGLCLVGARVRRWQGDRKFKRTFSPECPRQGA